MEFKIELQRRRAAMADNVKYVYVEACKQHRTIYDKDFLALDKIGVDDSKRLWQHCRFIDAAEAACSAGWEPVPQEIIEAVFGNPPNYHNPPGIVVESTKEIPDAS